MSLPARGEDPAAPQNVAISSPHSLSGMLNAEVLPVEKDELAAGRIETVDREDIEPILARRGLREEWVDHGIPEPARRLFETTERDGVPEPPQRLGDRQRLRHRKTRPVMIVWKRTLSAAV